AGLKEQVEKVNVMGYSELFKYLDGELSLDSSVNLIKQNTRRYAKRQITWFRGMDDIEYIDSVERAEEIMREFLRNRQN
ncbi:MAG TPA: tRNA (adenosine(37)-N6)-dimethylallyltransferase MiaA, partial [candidate division Zixibacteria bacterium]|nr:tRNA (adenosine(37)-N6)-dimethylallyltransferase MiaA [candidate division Zixibacteria bacterium]